MELRLVPRDPTCGYIDRWLWFPKNSDLSYHAAKSMCTMDSGNGELKAYWETETHVMLPVHFPLENPPFPVYDLRPLSWPHVSWECTAETRHAGDAAVWGRLQEVNGGVLHLGCGKGKTVHALRKIARGQGPALITVNTKDLMEQWAERIKGFLRIDGRFVEDAAIGVVSGPKKQWDRPIVIAMLQTLARTRVPKWANNRFRTVVHDECHHLTAATWMNLASIGCGDRIGLSATPHNKYGLDKLYMMHLGSVFYSDVTQDVIPTCYFVHVDTPLDLDSAQYRSTNGQLSVGKINTGLGACVPRNEIIRTEIQKALDKGRKVLCVSGSKDHCIALSESVPGSGLCIGDVKLDVRRDNVNNCDAIFGTMPLGKEGLDKAELDLVIIATPFRDKDVLQQVVGRVQRPKGKSPIVLVIQDDNLNTCVSKCLDLRASLESWGYPVKDMNRK